jgi:hypothetical protein
MTEAEWLAATDPRPMLTFIVRQSSDRKLRLFAVACCRRVWGFLSNEHSRRAVEVAERFADGLADQDELERAFRAGKDAYMNRDPSIPHSDAALAAFMACVGLPGNAAVYVSAHSVYAIKNCQIENEPGTPAHLVESREIAQQNRILCGLLQDFYGPLPFRPVTPDPDWLTSSVVALAEGIYAERAFDRLPILADALQDAGCENADILAHCRSDGPHVRGCWVVDLVLGKR